MKENQPCGCCLAEESINMCHEYCNGREKEVYTEMLLNTFNINISGFICKDCITKLQQAAEFKQQILVAQDNLKRLCNVNSNLPFKIEKDNDENEIDRFSDSDFMWEENQSQEGEELEINLESNNDRIKKAVFRKKIKHESNMASVASVQGKKVLTKDLPKTPCKKPISKEKNYKTKLKAVKDKQKKSHAKYEIPPVTQTEKDARENSLKLIINSNICLFRSYKTKFGCFMCNNTFVEAAKLREHSTTHTNTKLLATRISRWRGLSYKNVDISNLQCKKCSQNVNNLSELMTHLTEKHDITFSGTDIYLIPYKLVDENQCTLCERKFNSFLRLSIHMNTHSTNNVCEICGLSFINRLSLRMHVQSMHKEKKCPHCPAKFLTDSSKVAHLKKVHKVFNLKRYCNLCEKTFPYTYLLVKHKIEEHGAKKTVVNCVDCGKTFLCKTNLKTHVRSVHIKERNHPCEICGTSFFTKNGQKRHETTHNEEKSFSCSYCDVKFKSRDSCRRHMKRQHGHVFR